MQAPLVTVIVPVYNVEPYLPQCLDSIVGQSYERLEILVVDDGSTDGSGALCDDYARRDSRVRVVHKPNGGLSHARNAALDAMTGDVVMMVDGDDWIARDCVQALLTLMTDTACDVAVGRWQRFGDGGAPTDGGGQRDGSVRLYDRDQAIDDVFYQHTLTNSACSRLFRARLFDGVRFPVGKLYEDLAVAYPLLKQVARVAYTRRTVYYYRQRNDSITGHFTRQRTQVLDILDDIERQVTAEVPQHLPAVRSRQLSAYFNILLLCHRLPGYDDVEQRCWQGIKDRRWGCLLDGKVRLKNKLGILASLVGKRVFLSVFCAKM